MPKTKKIKKADVPRNVREALERVIRYNWDDEIRDVVENPMDDGTADSHVFAALVTLDNWLNGRSVSVEEYVYETTKQARRGDD